MIDAPRRDLRIILEAGYIYLGMCKYAEAKQVFEGLNLLTPEHEVPLVALGNVYFAQRNYLKAIRTLKEALELNPKSAFAKAHLGEALLFYEKKAEAVKVLEEAVALDPQGECGRFAKALKGLIDEGFDPKAFREMMKKRATETPVAEDSATETKGNSQ